MKKFFGIMSAAMMGLSLSFGGMVAGAVPAQAAGEYARCNNGITVRDWTGKDPRDCTPSGVYWLYNSNGQAIMKIQQANRTSPVWDAIKAGYSATQNWCSSNSATCSVMSSAAVAYVTYLITNR